MGRFLNKLREPEQMWHCFFLRTTAFVILSAVPNPPSIETSQNRSGRNTMNAHDKAAILDEMLVESEMRAEKIMESHEAELRYQADLRARRSMLGITVDLPAPMRDGPDLSKRVLHDGISELLKREGRRMRAIEIARGLQAAGVHTESQRGLLPNVLSVLGRRNDLFRRVGRGVYDLVERVE